MVFSRPGANPALALSVFFKAGCSACYVVSFVMRLAEPTYIQWLFVVIVMTLNFKVAADFTGRSHQQPSRNGIPD